MFMHFTYTVPHGPLLGQQETTSVSFIGFMKCISGTIVQEMLHNNSEASLKPCFVFIHGWPYKDYNFPITSNTGPPSTKKFYTETWKCISYSSIFRKTSFKLTISWPKSKWIKSYTNLEATILVQHTTPTLTTKACTHISLTHVLGLPFHLPACLAPSTSLPQQGLKSGRQVFSTTKLQSSPFTFYSVTVSLTYLGWS